MKKSRPDYFKEYNLFLLLLLLATKTAFGQLSIYKGAQFVDKYNNSDYKAGPINYSITQDENDILYFANQQGLLKYDGTIWELFKIKYGLYVLSVLAHQEKIYIGTQGEFGYFKPNETGRLIYHSLSDQLEEAYKFEEITEIHAVGNLIYFFTYTHIFIFDDKSINTVTLPDRSSATKLKDGLAVTQKSGENLLLFNHNGFSVFNTNSELIGKSPFVEIIPISKHSMLFFSKEKGIYLLENEKVYPWNINSSKILSSTSISAVIKTKDEKYLIGTKGSGILHTDKAGNLISIYNKNNGLANDAINSLYQDNFGNVWVTHDCGISKIDYGSAFTKISDNLSIKGAGRCVSKYNGELYLGTTLGLFKYNAANNSYDQLPNFKEEVFSIEQIGKKLFVGDHKGVFKYTEGEFEKISDWMGCRSIRGVPGYENKIILGGYHGFQILNINNDGSISTANIDYKGTLWGMEFDQQGYLWGTNGHKGISSFKIDFKNDSLENIQFYDGNDAFSFPYYIYVYKVDNKALFVGDGGVFQFNHSKQQFETAKKFDGCFGPELIIQELEEDHLGNVYYKAFTESGVILNPGKGNMKIIKKPFYPLSHTVYFEGIDYTFVDENNLFFQVSEGFLHFDPYKIIQQEADSFNIYIKQISIIQEEDSIIYNHNFWQTGNTKIEIPYQTNALRFSCSAVFYTKSEHTEYSYFIENFDKAWTAWTDKSEKEYINLPPGNYRFMVKAKNVFQTESEPAVFSFRILPPWYRTRFAYFLYAVTLSSLFFVWYFDLLQRHSKEKDIIKLENQKEIDELSKIKKEKIIKLQNEKLEAEVNYRNQELASTTLHLINKNQLLTEVKENLKETQHVVDDSTQVTGNIQRIISKIDRNIQRDSNWEMFQIHFDRVHVNFINRLREKHPNLSQQNIKIAAYARMNLSTKKMAELLNISVVSVEKARYRLRKKMNIARNENLNEYISKI